MSEALDLTRPASHSRSQQDVGAAYDRPRAPRSRMRGWIVVHSYPQAERWAQAQLHARGYETFLPLMAVRRRDRVIRSLWHVVETPLFARYLFVRFPGNWTPIRYCPGVYRIVSAGQTPSLASEAAVSALQALKPKPLIQGGFTPGTPVALSGGVLDGCQGVILKAGAEMALVSLIMLGQLREVSVSVDCLRERDE